MDRKLLEEIISDFESISKTVNKRLEQLYRMLDGERGLRPKFDAGQNRIKEQIEAQRREMMAQAEKMRQEAMAQVQESMRTSGGMGNMGMPNMMPGMPNMMPRAPMSKEEIESMRKELMSEAKLEAKSEEPKDD